MGSNMDRDQEKLFSEQVDRLLSGQEEKPDLNPDSELRSVMDFARKMTVLRSNPSPRFESLLKERLLRKLEEQEQNTPRKEKQSWVQWLIGHRPAWQAATAIVVILIIIGVTWVTGALDTGQPPLVSVPTAASPAGTIPAATTPAATKSATSKPATTTPPATVPATTRPAATSAPTDIPGLLLAADASTNKTAYVPGEEVKIEVTLKNIGSQTLNLDQFPPILSVMQSESRQPVYTFRAGKGFRSLVPNESVLYTVSWNQFDFNNQPAPYGGYYLELEDLDYQGQAVKLNLSPPASFYIQSATY